MRGLSRALGMALALATAACSTQGAENTAAKETPAAPARHSVSGLEVIPVTVTALDGKKHVFKTEVARSPEAQAQGLMYRESMAADEAMIFPRPQPRIASFWMANTPLPLDLVFVGPDGKVINVGQGKPFSEDRILSDGPASAIFEINAGLAEQLNIGPGATVEW